MGTAFLNISKNWLLHTDSHLFAKSLSCRSAKFTTGDFECMVRLKTFTLQKLNQEIDPTRAQTRALAWEAMPVPLDHGRYEMKGEWRKLHNAELHALYSSPNIIRNLKSTWLSWAGHVARMEQSRNAYTVLVRKPEGKRILGRPRSRWEDSIKMDLR